jgi:hypothetical protein
VGVKCHLTADQEALTTFCVQAADRHT